MAVSFELPHVLAFVQYLTPVATLTYFIVATVVSVVRLQIFDVDISPRLRKTVFGGLLGFTLLYVLQAGLIIDLIFVKPGIYGARPTNLHALESALVWIIIASSLIVFESASWYPYYGSWLLAIAAETTILALSLAIRVPNGGIEFALVSTQGAQILLLLLLTAVFVAWRKVGADPHAKDEEHAPLLGSPQIPADISTNNDGVADETTAAAGDDAASKKSKGGDDSESDDDDDSDLDGDDDDEDYWEDIWQKKQDKQTQKMKKRLKEEGGWYGYLKNFAVFLPYIWPARSFRLKLHLVGVGLCILAGRVLRPLQPTQLGRVVDCLTAGDPRAAFGALGLFILIDVVQTNIGTVRSWLWVPIETNTAKRLDKASYNHIMELSCDFHDSKSIGEVFQAMNQGQSVTGLIETIGLEMLPDFADLFIAGAYFYFLFGPYLTLTGIATGVLYVVVNAWTTTRSSHARRCMNKARRVTSQIKYDTVPNWRTVSYFNRVPHSQEKYGDATEKSNKMYLSWRLFSSFMGVIQNSLMDVGQFGAFILVAYDILYNGMPPGNFVILNNYWYSIISPLISLSQTMDSVIMDLVDAEALLKIWERKSKVVDGAAELKLNRGNEGHVKFDNVDFDYHKKKGTIEKLSFEAQPGQTIALVGETGAGKSTILKLLFRFYDVNGGAITIDGQDIRSVTLESLRDQIATVPQDPAMFNNTIMENLRYVRLDATDEEIHEACQAAAVHDKILKFSKGYASKVGERGVKLSGGELQRIAIARAILKQAPIILLDEATSSVDSETESLIQEGLKRLCKNKTTFVVAHRLSTIQHADRILVIKDGKIEEEGTPQQLLDKKGKYYKLWTKQFGIYDPFAKKDKKDASDSDQSTLAADEEDLIDLDDSKKGAKPGEQSTEGESVKKNEKKPALSVDTKTSLTPATSSAAPSSGSPSKSPTKAKFRPDAPEFVPRSRLGASQSESQPAQVKSANGSTAVQSPVFSTCSNSNDGGEQTVASRRGHSRAQSQSESGTSSTSRPASRPGIGSSSGPGLLALQQASLGGGTQEPNGQSDPRR